MRKKRWIAITSTAFIPCILIAMALPGKGSQFVANEVNIHYTDRGQGTPVILIHGFALNGNLNWRLPGTVRALAKNYRVITMDVRGHGRSDKPHEAAAYGKETVEDVVRLMDHLGIQKAHIVGYSMGGFITLKLLTTHPERFITAIACGAGWMVPDTPESHLMEPVAVSLREHGTMTELIEDLQPEGKKLGWLRRVSENFGMRCVNDTKALASVAEAFSQLAVPEEKFRANKIPAILIIGEKDPIKKAADALDGVLANSQKIIVPGGTHTSTIWRKQLRQEILKFLTEHPEEKSI